jgi:ABC-type nitrate/sulfonate/bicarbonate transport system substrate-binding protein
MKRYLANAAAAIVLFGAAAALAQDETIKVGYLAQVHDGPILAVEKALGGDYKLEYVKFLRYADAEIALSRGDIQMSSLGYVSAISAASRGGEPQFQFVTGQSRGAINLVCREDVKISDWAGLAGHTYGVLTGGPAEIFFNDALTTHGVDLGGIEKVTFAVPGPPLLQALKDGTIECMAVYEPFAASAVADGYGYYPPLDLADNSFLGINGGIAVNSAFLTENPEFVQKAVDVAVQAIESYPKDKTEWIAQVVEKLGIPENAAKLGSEHLVLDWKLYEKRAATLAGAVASLGVIKEVPSVEAIAAYFNYDFLAKTTGRQPNELGAAE